MHRKSTQLLLILDQYFWSTCEELHQFLTFVKHIVIHGVWRGLFNPLKSQYQSFQKIKVQLFYVYTFLPTFLSI